jgi:NADPH:quinone reductase-like Zn-dependent oxidoreductase
MRVWTCPRYGGPEVLTLATRPCPVPRAGEVLVRIVATTVSSADARLRSCTLPRGFGLIGRAMFGFTGPRQPVLGTELSGIIAAVGPGVAAWQPGAAVIGFTGGRLGCHAEYRILPAAGALVAKPPNLSFAEAAGLAFGGMAALDFLRRADLRAGERVLVLGAAGAVGTALLQLARLRGAHVTAMVSAANLDFVRALGADRVLDRAHTDFTAAAEIYDVIADTVGATTFARAHPHLHEHGRYLALAADLPGMFARPVGTKRSLAGAASERPEDLRELARLAAADLRVAVGRTFAFSELPEAHTYVSTGRKRGCAVVHVSAPPPEPAPG